MKQKFFMISEFAELVGVHPNTVRNWDRNGWLKPHHISPGGKRYYTQEQVDVVLSGGMAGSQREEDVK